MKTNITPRIMYTDLDNAAMVLRNRQDDLPKALQLIEEKPTNLQTHYSLLARSYQSIALFLYGLGYSLANVKCAFSNAAKTYLKVFELRGTEPRFPAYVATYDPSIPPSDPKSLVEFKKLHDDGEMDYSTTNSHDNYDAVCQALIGGEDSIAEKLAGMIWDPPNASYVGPGSFCTANDQHLAYALRELFQGNAAAAHAELDKLRKPPTNIKCQADMLRALLDIDATGFIEGLNGLLAWHGKEAPSKKNFRSPDFYICISGLGLCRLAVKRGLCTLDQLPQDNVFLPLDLIH